MKKFHIESFIILLCFVCFGLIWNSHNKVEATPTEVNADSDSVPAGLVMYDPDLSHVTFADTARILDSLYAERKHLCTPSTCSTNLGWEIALRVIIDSLEMEKNNSRLPQHLRYNNQKAFQEEMDKFYETTLAHYNKLDSTDPWNYFYASCDMLEKVIKPHTEKQRQIFANKLKEKK